MDVFVARHAIFNRDLSLFGYELQFRPLAQESAECADDTATLRLLANTLLSSGLEKLSANAPVFINFNREVLTSGWTSVFHPKSMVEEILESVDSGEQVIASCLEQNKLAYMLGLDEVVGTNQEPGVFAGKNFIKVDFCRTTKEEQVALARKLKKRGKRLVAGKVETPEDFKWAFDSGYDLFQGFFFARPTILKGRQVPVTKVNAVRMIRELQRSELDFVKLENLIRCDVSLSYKLFRYVNSALFSQPRQISSVKEALMIMGEIDVRRWMTLVTLPGLAAGKSSELIVHALVRARFCELLAEAASLTDASDAFLMGLFSLLDVLLDRPIADVLSEMSLPPSIKEPLLDVNYESPLAHVFRTAVNYQTADWIELEREIRHLPLRANQIPGDYLDAVSWSSEMFAGITCERPKELRASKENSWEALMAAQNANKGAPEASRPKSLATAGPVLVKR